MRLSLRFLFLLIPTLVALTVGFMWVSYKVESKWVSHDLRQRSKLILDSIHDSILDSLNAKRPATLHKLLNKISRDSRVVGVAVCSVEGKIISRSDAVPSSVTCEHLEELASGNPSFFRYQDQLIHQAVYALINDENITQGHTIILHDSSYMSKRGDLTRKYGIAFLLILGFLVSSLTILVYRWSVSRPVAELSRAIRGVLTGNITSLSKSFQKTDFAHLVKNLDKILAELHRAKATTTEESTAKWTVGRFRSEVQRLFGGTKLCVIANREPCIHNRKGTTVETLFPASGLVSALEPIVRASSGLWIGHGSGTADRETADKNGIILVPPNKPEYALKRVWLSKEEEQGYYYGFANEGLWPLCHIAHTRPIFREEDWVHYLQVNEKFARAFVDEVKNACPITLVQDYHFALLPTMVRKLKPNAVLSLFWHIPWPNPESIGICPWKNEILLGMLGSDLIGFHTQYHCNNFLDCADRFLEARVDRSNFSVTIRGHTCFVKPFPISTEWPTRYQPTDRDFIKIGHALCDELSIPKNVQLGVGIDRLDYTKGITERFLAVEKLLERHPDLIGKFVFIQIAAPSRTHIKRYQDLQSEVQELADRINWKFHKAECAPILLRLSHHDPSDIFRYYRAADTCIVSSLHDGMNLVAKEYIASRNDNDGVLVLSFFAGAAHELTDALIVNPYDISETANAIYKALTMNEEERRSRMTRLRESVSNHNIYSWAAEFLSEIHKISQQQEATRMVAT
ncbi:MAG: trehalose-6-phosphate synthase [Deltaproteobacteria bacterium]|nr:trehalose-6-phosphate synthase [Deltaproteobacteria bacterium]